jgi:hypothetical protein
MNCGYTASFLSVYNCVFHCPLSEVGFNSLHLNINSDLSRWCPLYLTSRCFHDLFSHNQVICIYSCHQQMV